ncbi:MAG: hypothetical protein BKP49_10400 [Treponema sp. CETP13]|nr:MAG: hypothetical protein BKP49_10400 [Treponema sp. CETP13]
MKESLLNKAEKMWIRGRKSPLKVLIASVMCAVLLVFLCGGSFWIPVSRMNNITLKNMLTPISKLAALPGELVGIDEYIPNLRLKFLESTGLSNNPNWDTHYFNQKESSMNLHNETTESSLKTNIDANEQKLKLTDSNTFSDENPLTIYIFGDSQISSLGAGFDRLTKNISAIKANHLGIISSGFIRDEYYNWSAKLADVTSKKTYDAAIFMLGMNDNIDFTGKDGNKILRGTQEWEDYYTKRCCALLDEMIAEFPKIYWLGMPKTKSKKYDDHLIYIDTIHKKIAAMYDPTVLIRVSIRDIFPGKDKEYRDNNYFPDGKVLRVMGDDGIHFTISGGQWVMNSLYQKIITDFDFKKPLQEVVLPD